MIEPGIYPDISFEDYLADPCPEPSLSRGTIVQLLDCPAIAWWNHPRLNPALTKQEKDESKFDPGKAAHNLLLEGGNSVEVIGGFDDWKKDKAKEARKEARANNKTPLLTKQFDLLSEITESARRQIRGSELGIRDLLTEGDAEVTYVWKDKQGTWYRVRPDWIRKNRSLILDYKLTGTSPNPEDYSGQINKMDYPIQSVFYRRIVGAVENNTPDFVFVAQSDNPPYLCSFHGIDFMNEDMAGEKIDFARDLWQKCRKSGKWPGYPKRICYAEPKPWDLAAWEIKKGQILEAV